MNSRSKGCRGELEWRDVLRAHGYEAERGQQHAGGTDSPDVRHSVPGVHFEVKRTERLELWPAIRQARRDAGNKLPVVVHRPNRERWVAILDAEDLLRLLAASR